MQTLTKQKKKLQKELNSIESKLQKETIKNYLPIFKKKYEGRYFKNNNSYSHDKKWFLFIKVTSIKADDIYDTLNGVTSLYTGYSFQTTTTPQIEIEEIRTGYVHSLGEEITEEEFNNEWDKMIDRLNRIKKW